MMSILNSKKMIVCIAGKNKIAVDIAKSILDMGYKLIACVNSNDNGLNGWQPSFKKFCYDNRIEIYSLNDVEKIENLLFLSLEYDKIISPDNFKTNRLYNIHFSLLPKYKGMYTSILPILFNESFTGVTFHRIDSGIDTGGIIFQRKIKINKIDNSEILYSKYIENGIHLIKENLIKIISNNLIEKPQSFYKSSYFSKKYFDFQNININPYNTAFQINNYVRAFAFRPYQLSKFQGKTIYLSEISTLKSVGKPGEVILEDEYKLIINTIDYQIILYKDQLENLFDNIIKNDFNKVRLIIENRFPIQTVNKKGWNALIVACYHGRNEIIDYLIENGANINSVNYNGTTVLMYAMSYFESTLDSKTFNKILSYGADIYLKDYNGKNIFDYAEERNNSLVIQELKKIKKNEKD